MLSAVCLHFSEVQQEEEETNIDDEFVQACLKDFCYIRTVTVDLPRLDEKLVKTYLNFQPQENNPENQSPSFDQNSNDEDTLEDSIGHDLGLQKGVENDSTNSLTVPALIPIPNRNTIVDNESVDEVIPKSKRPRLEQNNFDAHISENELD